jgi:hypothetical protein
MVVTREGRGDPSGQTGCVLGAMSLQDGMRVGIGGSPLLTVDAILSQCMCDEVAKEYPSPTRGRSV